MSTYTDLIDDIEPKSSDDAVIASVLEKYRIVKRKKIRNLTVSAFIITIFMAMTITVGAVNEWDYTAVLQRVFNNNPIVAESMKNEINYRVVNNTYDGITFELTGLYADDESLFLVVDITSEKPVFNEQPFQVRGGSLPSTLALISGATGSEIVHYPGFSHNDFSYYFIDEKHILAVTFFSEPVWGEDHGFISGDSNVFPFPDAVADGREFVLFFGDTNYNMNTKEYNGLPLIVKGSAELRFTVEEINKQDVILIYPDVPLRDVAVLKELKITPFSFLARFEGDGIGAITYTHDYGIITNIHIKMGDGEIIPLESWIGGSKRGLLRSFSIGYHGTDYENHSWYASFQHDKLLVIDDIVAVIVDNVEIPVR